MIKKQKSYFPGRNILSYSVPKQKPKNRLRFFLIFLFIVLILISVAIYAVFHADFLKVGEISVEGNRLLESNTVTDAVAEAIANNSRIASILGRNHIWFWVFTPKKLLFSSPTELKSVSIRSGFLNSRVIISVEERSVVHIVCKKEEKACYGITGDGLVFAQIPEVKGSLILQIEDISSGTIAVGDKYFENEAFLKRVNETTVILESHGFVPALIRVGDHALYEWEAIFPSGVAMYFSGMFVPKNLPLILDELRKNGDITKYRYIDFRVEDKVFYQ